MPKIRLFRKLEQHLFIISPWYKWENTRTPWGTGYNACFIGLYIFHQFWSLPTYFRNVVALSVLVGYLPIKFFRVFIITCPKTSSSSPSFQFSSTKNAFSICRLIQADSIALVGAAKRTSICAFGLKRSMLEIWRGPSVCLTMQMLMKVKGGTESSCTPPRVGSGICFDVLTYYRRLTCRNK